MLKFIEKHHRSILFATMLLSILMHSHLFNTNLLGHHVWRQTQTQTVINNFAFEDFNILNPRANEPAHTDRLLRMEFPVMQWLFAIFFKLFGNHIIITRLLTLLIGFFSMLGMYRIGKTIFKNRATGVIAAWTICFSPAFYYFIICPMPDNFALCCGIWALNYYFIYQDSYRTKHILLSALFLLFATLAKLPFILYGAVAIAFFIQHFRHDLKRAFTPTIIYIITIIPAMAWYVAVIPSWGGNGVIKGITDTGVYATSIQEFIRILSGTITDMLPGILLNYGSLWFFIAAFVFLIKHKTYKSSSFLPLFITLIFLLLYFFYELNMIDLVHDYYLFPFLPLIFIIVTYGGKKLFEVKNKVISLIAVFALLSLPVIAEIKVKYRWNVNKPVVNKVLFNDYETIRNIIPEDALCIAGNDGSPFIMLYYLNRKGWIYNNDFLRGDHISYFMNYGAEYLVTDGNVDEKDDIKVFLNKKVYDKGNLRIYSLKLPD